LKNVLYKSCRVSNALNNNISLILGKSDRATSMRFTLGNVNAGDTVNFKFHNSESSYGIMEKRSVISVLEPLNYKNIK